MKKTSQMLFAPNPKSGRLGVAVSFAPSPTMERWYIITAAITGLAEAGLSDRQPLYEIYLYTGESFYDADRKMTINPRDYFIVEIRDGMADDEVLLGKALPPVIDAIMEHIRRKS